MPKKLKTLFDTRVLEPEMPSNIDGLSACLPRCPLVPPYVRLPRMSLRTFSSIVLLPLPFFSLTFPLLTRFLSWLLSPSAAMIPLPALSGLSNTLIFHFTIATTSSILMVIFAAFWTLLISKSHHGLKE
jgi:hypothetical protein